MKRDQWTAISDLPYQEVFIPSLPPTTNHGYRIGTDEEGKARMSKTSATRKWMRDAQLILDTVGLEVYQGRCLVLITQYVKDFRSDTDGIVKFVVDALQKQGFRNDNQVDCVIPHRLRTTDPEQVGVSVTIVHLGHYEISAWDFRQILVQGAGFKKERQRYNNDSRRGK